MHVAHDITARKRDEKEQELTVQFLSIANRSITKEELVRDTLEFFHKESGCEVVGIRLKEDDHYPCFERKGFPEEFVLAETSLCARDGTASRCRRRKGFSDHGVRVRKRDPWPYRQSMPFFTAAGSFWSNSTTALLAASTEEDGRAQPQPVQWGRVRIGRPHTPCAWESGPWGSSR